MDLPGANQVDISRPHAKMLSVVHLGIIRPGAVVQAFVSFDVLTAVQHAIERPVVCVLVNTGPGVGGLN